MAALSDEVKFFIVKQLACFDTPSQVTESVKDEFGLDVPKQQVAAYDPTKFAGRRLSQKWREIFEATRKRFLEDASEIPIASKSFRLRSLNRIHDTAGKNKMLAMQALEQAAKEAGGIYESRRLDPPKAPGTEDQAPRSEYRLAPDEDVPAKPIL